MIVLGTIWGAAGGAWLYHLGPTSMSDEHIRNRTLVMPIAVSWIGLVLLKNGVWPARPKAFEDEIPDANPDLDGPNDLDID